MRKQFALDRHGDQVELLGAVAQDPGQLGKVWGLDGDRRRSGPPEAGDELAAIGWGTDRPAGTGTIPGMIALVFGLLGGRPRGA